MSAVSPADARLRAAETDLVAAIGDARVVPVTALDDGDQAEALARALLAGGLSCIEITFRTSAAAEAIGRARAVDGMIVGAGTVLSPEQARQAAEAGAQFAVAPGTNDDVVAACRELGLPFFPGVATPSEIEHARALGLRVVKVFPAATVGGVDFLKAVSATYPEMRYVPTGGVTSASLADYLAVPSVLAVGGSWLARPELLRAGRYDEIERLAREARGVTP
jgi:2-dehydro-3-deoxyphosphogluconate aldolase/(4S)-4-hydroxy-2-oxoglutarate aldolase